MASLPFDPEKLSASDRVLYDGLVARRKAQGTTLKGPYLALMNHLQLCQRIEELGFYLKFQGHLPRPVYQFVVLAVAGGTGAAFVWKDHVEHARAAGIPEDVIELLHTRGLTGTPFPAPYDLVARVLTATLPWKNIPEEVQSAAIAAYGVEGFVEIVVVSGFYQMFAAINQGFDVR